MSMVTYWQHSDFIGEESELLVIKVVLKVDINGSQCFRYITLLVPANQLQCETTPYRVSVVKVVDGASLLYCILC